MPIMQYQAMIATATHIVTEALPKIQMHFFRNKWPFSIIAAVINTSPIYPIKRKKGVRRKWSSIDPFLP